MSESTEEGDVQLRAMNLSSGFSNQGSSQVNEVLDYCITESDVEGMGAVEETKILSCCHAFGPLLCIVLLLVFQLRNIHANHLFRYCTL